MILRIDWCHIWIILLSNYTSNLCLKSKNECLRICQNSSFLQILRNREITPLFLIFYFKLWKTILLLAPIWFLKSRRPKPNFGFEDWMLPKNWYQLFSFYGTISIFFSNQLIQFGYHFEADDLLFHLINKIFYILLNWKQKITKIADYFA